MVWEKLFVVLTVAWFHCSPCHGAEELPVKGHPSGIWSHGFMIGTVAEAGVPGLVLPSMEATVYTGILHREKKSRREKCYVSTYDASVNSALEIWAETHGTASADDQRRVALNYIYPFPLNVFHRNKFWYWVTSVSELNKEFTQTDSYKIYKNTLVIDSDPPCHHYKGVRHGYIYHVSRGGTD